MVIASPDIFVQTHYSVAVRRESVEFELWLWQQHVEVQQFEILVLIDNPGEMEKGVHVSVRNFFNLIKCCWQDVGDLKTHIGHLLELKHIFLIDRNTRSILISRKKWYRLYSLELKVQKTKLFGHQNDKKLNRKF